MQAEEFARLLGAHRTGKNRWIAKCPAHPDRHPSLSIAVGNRTDVVFRCMSQGCGQGDILKAMGLTWRDLLGEPTPEIREQMGRRESLEILSRQVGYALVLIAIDSRKRNYWRAVHRRLSREWRELWAVTYPEKCVELMRARFLQQKIKRIGWDAMWEEYWDEEGISGEREI